MTHSTRLSWSDYVTRYEEASNLENDLQGDVADIESQSAQEAMQGWYDLSQEVLENPMWQDLLTGSTGASAKSYISNIENAAETYMSNITLQVEQPNSPGNYINLYAGTSGMDGNGDIDENFDETTTDDDGDTVPVAANFFEMISGKYTTLINDYGDAYYDNGGGYAPGLATNWSNSNNGLSFNTMWDGNGNDNGMYCSAQGTLQQWMPFIHLGAADDSALNAALQA